MQPYQHTSNFAHAGWTGWVPRTDRGLLRLTGADALGFLQALVTNDVASLSVGGACDAAWLTPQGRMITDMNVYRGEREVLVSVPAELAASLAQRLDLLVFAEDVQVADASQLIHQIQLVGESMAGAEDVFFDAAREADVRAALDAAGLRTIDADEAEALRIDAGRPRWGVDMNEETIPLEAGLLDRMISQTKGCYVGQEVIVRVLHRGGGRVAKRLMKIEFAPGVVAIPAAGAPITIDGVDVGRITSAARRPHSLSIIALGYIHRDHATEGAAVMAGGAAAKIGGAAS
jgi:folate-binding protein YgfZ